MIKKLFSILLTLSIVVQSTAPLTHAQNTRRGRARISNTSSENAVDLNSLPAFPEDKNRPEVDWSETDWEREIILPQDGLSLRAFLLVSLVGLLFLLVHSFLQRHLLQ